MRASGHGGGLSRMALPFGVLVIAASAWSSFHTAERPAYPGKVIAIVEYRNDASFAPRVQFALPDGTVKEFVNRNRSYPSAYAVGDSVEVTFEPAIPDSAQIKSVWSPKTTPLIGYAVGGLLMAVGLGRIFLSRR